MKHILIVDDDERICVLLARLLRRGGYEVSIVYSADEAIRAAQYFYFDAVVTDVMMPEISGNEFVRMIREGQTYFHKFIPVMMLSAGIETHQRITGLREGADDYLVKPFEPDELLMRLSALLRRAAQPIYQKPKTVSKNDTIRVGSYYLDIMHGNLHFEEGLIALSETESEALMMLMQNKNVPISRSEMMVKFFPETADNPHSRAADVMIARLRRKIETLTQMPSPIVTKRGEGYVWQD